MYVVGGKTFTLTFFIHFHTINTERVLLPFACSPQLLYCDPWSYVLERIQPGRTVLSLADCYQPTTPRYMYQLVATIEKILYAP